MTASPRGCEIQVKQRGKEQIANVAQRNSVYQTIVALHRAGLIAIHGVSRDERRPERTAYEATDLGRQTLRTWIRHGLANVAREFPEFPAVLSLLDPTLRPEELGALLEGRTVALKARLAELGKASAGVPRIFLLEEEYMAAVVRAELKWLLGVIADLRAGSLGFPTRAEMRRLAPIGGPSEEAIRRAETELERADHENSANAAGAVQKRRRSGESPKRRPAKKTKR